MRGAAAHRFCSSADDATQLLLLDEPFAALDPATKESLYALLQQLRAEFHCSVLFVTHDFHEAQRLSDRVGVLMEGRLQGIVPAEALFTASWPPEVREFLGLTEGVHL